MNRMLRLARSGAVLVALAMVLASCESLQFSMMKDNELVQGGITAWNSDRIEAARAYWKNIKDPALKTEWLGRLDQFDALEKSFETTTNLPAADEPALLAGWNDSVKQYQAFPTELKLPAAMKPSLTPVAMAIVRDRINANKVSQAKEFMKQSNDFLGGAADYSADLKEIDDMAAWKALERNSDGVLADARAKVDFNDQIDGYEAAIASYAKVETGLRQQAKDNQYPAGSPMAGAADKMKRKRVDAGIERDKKLRDRSYSFKERIGEIFARSPEGDQAGSMDPHAILAFYMTVQADVEATQKELVDFAAKYPKTIDKDMLKDVDAQKQDLLARIVQVTAEVKKAEADAKVAAEIASRGKVVLPLLIGLFNPQPGTKGADQKSRPGKFRGTLSGDAVYWWGMVDIPKGQMNDLVFTVNDGRPVRVFNDNTLSGSKIEEKQLKNLVNMQNKVGNSWPVMNAGAQLPSGKYFFEVGKGKDSKYSGDVVVYSSFIVRMR